MEQVLYTRNNNTITLFSFQRNVVQYTLTGSKTATNLLGYWEPAGGYTTILNYIKPKAPVVKCPAGDVAIENEQRVGRSSGRIRKGASIRVVICTTMSFINTEQTTNLQQQKELAPKEWQKRDDGTMKKLLSDIETAEQSSMGMEFRKYRTKYINEIIQRISGETDSQTCKDYVKQC